MHPTHLVGKTLCQALQDGVELVLLRRRPFAAAAAPAAAAVAALAVFFLPVFLLGLLAVLFLLPFLVALPATPTVVVVVVVAVAVVVVVAAVVTVPLLAVVAAGSPFFMRRWWWRRLREYRGRCRPRRTHVRHLDGGGGLRGALPDDALGLVPFAHHRVFPFPICQCVVAHWCGVMDCDRSKVPGSKNVLF